MFVYERPIRFEEVDAAGIVFFSRFLAYCHEAMAALLAPLDGGYARLVVERKLGLPAVHVEMDFTSPLRFGDVALIEVRVDRIGASSCVFRYTFLRQSDRGSVATVKHVCALSDLTTWRSVTIPDDLRAILSSHLSPATT